MAPRQSSKAAHREGLTPQVLPWAELPSPRSPQLAGHIYFILLLWSIKCPSVPRKILAQKVLASASLFSSEIWCLNISWSGGKFLCERPIGWRSVALPALSLLGLREAKESQGMSPALCLERTPVGPRHCGPGRGGGRVGSWREGQAGAFCDSGLRMQVKMMAMMKVRFLRAWQSPLPSLGASRPSPQPLIWPRGGQPSGRRVDAQLPHGALSS